MTKSSRYVIVMTSIILTILFLIVVTFIDATVLKDIAFPAFMFLGAVGGGQMVTKGIEKSKWSKPDASE